MNKRQNYTAAVARLRTLHERALAGDPALASIAEMIAARDAVLARYQPVFRAEALAGLTEEEFRGFLLFRNNHHWESLHRLGPAICKDMPRLREALTILLDESRPIAARIDVLMPKGGPNFVERLHRAVITPILMIAHPTRYGVFNNVSRGAMMALGLWPESARGASAGERYAKINDVLLETAEAVGCDLWALDALWWPATSSPATGDEADTKDADADGPTAPEAGASRRFGLERHLHDFLLDNWDHLDLGREWALYEEDGEVVGSELATDIGRIDLLARHRREARWLVVELKREQSSDATVGQVLRYMGWVQHHLAQRRDTVEGLIIAGETDTKLDYALMGAPAVSVRTYEVEFRLLPHRPFSP